MFGDRYVPVPVILVKDAAEYRILRGSSFPEPCGHHGLKSSQSVSGRVLVVRVPPAFPTNTFWVPGSRDPWKEGCVVQRPPGFNAFEFVVLSGLRAAQLMLGCTPRVASAHKVITTAQMEVAEWKVVRAPAGAVGAAQPTLPLVEDTQPVGSST